MEEAIITASNIEKTFKIPHEKNTSMKQAAISFLKFKKKTFSEFKVLDGISFEVYEGEFFGIIGRNGSGKSTLLKILAGIYTYDKGKLEIKGKISPFLELGVGFNPELSGYENVYLNGSILGLSRAEIREKMDEIIEFSELKDFMDQKLKNYSSGMQVRLAFSVAIHAHAPIILLDEVLAVGDTNFQRKCFKIFDSLKAQGKTIIFVSHSMESIQRFCDRAMLIHKGKIRLIGEPARVAFEYEQINAPNFVREEIEQKGRDKVFRVKDFKLLNKAGITNSFFSKEDIIIDFKYRNNFKKDVPIDIMVSLKKEEVELLQVSSQDDGKKIIAKKGICNTRLI